MHSGRCAVRAMRRTGWLLTLLIPFVAHAATPQADAQTEQLVGTTLPVTQQRLANGLRVVYHVDRSDPVVAVALGVGVGSGREVPGRTGLAHLFEHLFFLDSENLGPGGLDKLSTKVGGSGAAGNTSRDVTIYHQAVPSDALEKMLWAEADKLGWFINTVSAQTLARERQVVKNEKRQAIDNQPYGQTDRLVLSALYAADHPYSHDVIGSLEDLDAATLRDVQAFHRRWYHPGNATLVIAGNFDPVQAHAWVERYFGEIPAGEPVARMAERPSDLSQAQRLLYVDPVAPLPQLTLAWPSVPADHPDGPVLDILLDLLTAGRHAPLTRGVVSQGLADKIAAHQHAGPVSGELYMQVQAFDSVDLDRVLAAIDEGFARFERDGVDPRALARAKAVREMGFHRSLQGVQDKAELIARFVGMTGRPDFADILLSRLAAVSAADLERVYRQYVKGKPRVLLGIVPPRAEALGLTGARAVFVAAETASAVEPPAAASAAPAARTPSRIDRSIEPAYGPKAARAPLGLWRQRLANGLELMGIEDRERPIVSFEIALDGGTRLEPAGKQGATQLLSRLMLRGTGHRDTETWEAALAELGAELSAEVRTERIVIRGDVLARNFPAAVALVAEMLTQPRWNDETLDSARTAVLAEIADAASRPERVAGTLFRKTVYPHGDPRARDPLGNAASVSALTLDDLRALHARAVAPANARVRIIGAISGAEAQAALRPLETRWTARAAVPDDLPAPPPPAAARMHLRDVPGAKQTALVIGTPAMARDDPDYYPATVMNFILGGGGFASRLVRELREEKGYTYSIRSRFEGADTSGLFLVETSVRTDVTLDAVRRIRRIMADYATTFTEADLALTRESLAQRRARASETSAAKLRILADIGDYGLPTDYQAQEDAAIAGMTVDTVRGLAKRYVQPDRMQYVFVGDAQSQAAPLKTLGLGRPELIKGQQAAQVQSDR